VLIELYYRLSVVKRPNLRPDFRSDPLPPSAWEADQSETRFFILRFFEVLIKLYYSLSAARSPNLRSASTLLIINQLFADCPETPFRRERAERVLGRALLVDLLSIL
jgi:hypothetical protein